MPLSVIAALAVAVLSVSSSGPMIAYVAVPALAIAFWRNAMAVAVLAPAALARRFGELVALTGPARREGVLSILAGVALAFHFACWVPSVRLTTVATSTALVATQPVWQGMIAAAQGRRLPWVTWVGIGLAVAGAGAAMGADVAVSGRAVLGDLLAVAGAVAGAAYVALGERARATTSTTSYTAVCYTVCATALLIACLAARVPLGGYTPGAWLVLAGIAVGPQLLGHSLFNFALRRVAATTISVIILLEVPGAAFISWAWLGQVPRPAALAGLGLLLAGVVTVVLTERKARDGAAAPVAETEVGVVTP
jgi:drug/metabolite transporter (DMT)-like permease